VTPDAEAEGTTGITSSALRAEVSHCVLLPPNKPLKLPAEQASVIDSRCWSGFPGVGRPW